MILDNKNKNLKVYEWIAEYTEDGRLDIVSGYFTIAALAYLSELVNSKITEFRFIFGDIVNIDSEENRPLDLLNENITVDAALKLRSLSQKAVFFLKQDKVVAKTLEPNFCHAKICLFAPQNNDDRNKYFISGSSNLTEAGLGLKKTGNVELNIAETGNNNQYKELINWFEDLWKKPQAHKDKTIILKDGSKEKIDFKQYLINEIQRVFIEYTPRDIYYKVLFELFGNRIIDEQNDPEFNKQIGRLENSVIYDRLYEFQKKGALSLIRMLQKYNGAILADAVGLGKTWTALAVIKFFRLQGRETLLLCPKKLEANWNRYKKYQDSQFEKDGFDYFIRFYTDLIDTRLEKYTDRSDKYFRNENPKLIVIDESHNLRNDKSKRYKLFLNKILKKNPDVKVLLLSATPINNSLIDIRNQFKLTAQGEVRAYNEKLGVKNIDYAFRTAQKEFNKWREGKETNISEFIKKLPAGFFALTDALTVARTRKAVEGGNSALTFPVKAKPENIFVTPKKLGSYDSFEELFERFPPMLSGYQPSRYLETDSADNKDILRDERSRDRFLVKMLYILMVKRLESSWFSFYSTVKRIKEHHQNALDKIEAYQKNSLTADMRHNEHNIFEDDDMEEEADAFTLGKKRPILIADIDKSGNLELFKADLKTDLKALDNLFINMQQFCNQLKQELKTPNNLKSADDKLERLIFKINEKRDKGENNRNQKAVIFTAYYDTANYLFEQLKSRGFNKIAIISGLGAKTDDKKETIKNFEPTLQRFAPYTKLFCEKEWDFEIKNRNITEYRKWKSRIKIDYPKVYEKLANPIDILIATDALSEGQNLQDADMVINYDIHWNPVRIIQRMGRIDRLGSPNKKIFGINFWPSNNINAYLNLQNRIEQKMAAMKLGGAEVDPSFSKSFEKMIKDEALDRKMNARMMKLMETTWEDIEISDKNFGFNNLSLEPYRQEMLEELNKEKSKYLKMPKAVYTGFKADKRILSKNGIIALLGYPAKPPKKRDYKYSLFDLIYIDINGKQILLNQKDILDALFQHKDKKRFVPKAVDKGEEQTIKQLSDALKKWLADQAKRVEILPDGTKKNIMGKEAQDILNKLKTGDKNSLKRLNENIKTTEKYQPANFDLITWFLIAV